MAFEVILLHRMSWKGYDNFFFRFLKECELFSVPVFMILAFYFSAKTLEEGENEKLKNRFIRLIIPQVGWAIVCWVVYLLTDIIFMHEISHSINDLFVAIVSGCRQNTNPSTWFQAVLILLTVIYCLVFKLVDNKKAWVIVLFSFIASILIQLNGNYYRFFEDKPYELVNTIGRIFEMMPYAAVGLLLRHVELYERLKEKRYIVLLVSLVLFAIGFYLPFPDFEGFFAGLYPLYMAICLFVFFLFLPLQNISEKGKQTIMVLSRYTLGIYCAHRLVYGIIEIIYELTGINPGSFLKCIIVYVVCYVMSYIMCLFPFEVFKKMVD